MSETTGLEGLEPGYAKSVQVPLESVDSIDRSTIWLECKSEFRPSLLLKGEYRKF